MPAAAQSAARPVLSARWRRGKVREEIKEALQASRGSVHHVKGVEKGWRHVVAIGQHLHQGGPKELPGVAPSRGSPPHPQGA